MILEAVYGLGVGIVSGKITPDKYVVSRDIAVKYGIRNISIIKKLVIYLISHIGKEFSYNSLKKMLDIKSVQTVIDYISFFEDAYLIFTINKFSYSYKKQQVNPKKVYSIDKFLSFIFININLIY